MTKDMPVIDMYFHHKDQCSHNGVMSILGDNTYDRRWATGRREKGLDVARAA